ncbi:MAG TPA: alpha/beta hydrolase [Pyrinomonadaceae bacterium]|nr:alpha/beta hydrolase [Pyrinomonadaceae bacterium]
MPSLPARLFSAYSRAVIRRERWGRDERAVARRARLLFGTPAPLGWAFGRGVRVEKVQGGDARGEWITPARPDGDDAGAGVVLYLHGGGYVSCSPATHRPVTAALARLTGSRVFAPDYRLAPEHRYPAALDDAVAAYRRLLDRGVPPASLSVAGDSAGGGLALALLLRARDGGLPTPASAVCFSPWTDLAGTGRSVRANDGRCAMFRTPNIEEFASAYLGAASALDPYASPAHAADFGGLPPVLLQVGSTELLLDDARAVHEKITAAGGESRLEVYEDLMHCWQMLDGLVPEARAALRSAADFINEHTAPNRPPAVEAARPGR